MRQRRQLSVLGLLTVAVPLALVACGAPADSPGALPSPTPAPTASYFDGTITLELVAPSEVRQGEWLEGLDVVMTNHGSEPFDFYYSGNLLDFQVLDGQGNVLWRYLGASVQPLGMFTLEPGEAQAMSKLDWASKGRWDLRDAHGLPVVPGGYKVKGVVNLLLEDPGPGTETQRLETPTHTLTVREAPLPDYAQVLKLELIAPSEARAGERILMDLRVTNRGDKPLVLWWSGGSVIPAPNYLDVIIFKDGKEIWRATAAHGIRHQGHVILGPGESRTMSGLFEGYGEPWFWDQRADCGEHRFEPCAEPVGPGAYTVRGVANVSPPETLEQTPPFEPERATVVTAPHQLVIIPL